MKLSKKIIAAALSAATAAVSMASSMPIQAADTETEQQFCAPISEVVTDSGLDIDYARALQYSLYFYDANMCGKGVDSNCQLTWRGNCHTYDSAVSTPYGTLDLSGGIPDAGDHAKFGLPGAYSATVLGWSYYEFKDAFTQTGQAGHLKTITDYFCDYFRRCTVMDGGNVKAFCYQVGDGNVDHSSWQSPEKDTMQRPVTFADAGNPATDVVAERVEFLGSGNGGGMQPPAANGTGSGNANGIGGGMGNGSAPNAEGLSSNGGGKGGMGGLLGGSSGSVSSKLVKMLQKNSDSYRWVAATTGSQNAASYQLATECSVMPIGGFNGSDPAPTLAQFKKWVKQGLIHYYIAGGHTGGTQIGGSSASSEIASWVQQNFESTTVDGVTVYDLTQQSS